MFRPSQLLPERFEPIESTVRHPAGRRPRVRTFRRSLACVVAASCAAVIVGCSSGDNPPAPSPATSAAPAVAQLSETSARDRIQHYLQETLDALPRGLRLTTTPEHPGDVPPNLLRARPSLPCDGDLNNTTGPVKTQIQYWTSGIPNSQGAKYFDLIEQTWRDRGWPVTEPEPSIQASTSTPDGYTLITRKGSPFGQLGDDTLALAGISPCFTKSTESTVPLPPVIEQR